MILVVNGITGACFFLLSFDMVITEMTMPKMTGTDMAREMARIRAVLPIILCTGYSTLIDETSAKDAGINALCL